MSTRKNTPDSNPHWQPETRLIHSGGLRSPFGETSEALFLTSGFVYETAEHAKARFAGDDPDGYIYSRFANPTISMFEERMKALEGAQAARATATGMAAVTSAMLCFLNQGDHVVAARALFGSCRYVIEELLPRFGITSTLIDGTDLDAWRNAVTPQTKAFFFETPSNPTLELIDIAAVSAIAKDAGARVVVDNVFATPMLQRPMEHGADVVIYSATKHIDGQGRCLAGIILSDEEFVGEYLHNFMRQTGPSVSPFNAWIMLKGLETLPTRVKAATQNAVELADHLADLPGVKRVIYPGRADHPQADIARKQMSAGGNMVAVELTGGEAHAFAVMNALEIALITNNLGDTKTLITHPTTTTHQRLSEDARLELGITDGMIRISLGLEASQDLITDFTQAIEKAHNLSG